MSVNRAPELPNTLNGSCLLLDRDGNLWAGTIGQGLWRINRTPAAAPRAKPFAPFAGELGLTSNVVRSLFEDREGNLWVGTQSGLNRLSEASLITMLSDDDEVSQAVPTVTAATADGSVWLGTENGLYRFADGQRQRYGQVDGLPTPIVTALHSKPGGPLWVATDPGGVAQQLKSGRFRPVSLPPHVHLPFLWVIAADSEDGVWLADASRGVFRLHDNKLTSFDNVSELKDTIAVSALVDRRGRVWLGLAGGRVVVYEKGTFRSYAKEDGLASGDAAVVFEDSTGTIWVGSDNGLGRFDDGRFVSATAANGFAGGVRAIVEDAQGFLWLGVAAGIVRMNPGELNQVAKDASYRIRYDLYDIADGLRGAPMVRRGYPTAARAGDGTLWFVTSNGVAVAYPSRARRHLPHVAYTEEEFKAEVAAREAKKKQPLVTTTAQR